MGGSTRTFNTTPASTNAFQELLYNNILGIGSGDNTPNYANNAMFAPSLMGRRAAGGNSYYPSVGRGSMSEPVFGSGLAFDPRRAAGVGRNIPQRSGIEAVLFDGPIANVNSNAEPRTAVLKNPAGRNPNVAEPNGYYLNGRPIPRPRSEDDAFFYPGTNVPRIGAPRTDYGQQFADTYNQIFSALPAGPPGVGIGDLPIYDTAISRSVSTNAPTLGTLTRQPGESDANYNIRAQNFNTEQGQFANLLSMIQSSAGGSGRGVSGSGNGYTPATITAPVISQEGTTTQSADRIMRDVTGQNSMFANNILPAYTNLFEQQNALAAAAAKESAGNLTGSGHANTIATALNRNIPQQQALIADTINNLVAQEIQRQGQGAGLAATRNITQAGMGLQAQTTSAQLAQAAEQMRLQAEATGRSDLLQMANTLSQRAQFQAGLEQQTALANAGWANETGMFNAGQENAANASYFNAGVNRNTRQAELDQQRQLALFQSALNNGQFNAQQMQQLLSMLFQGQAPLNVQTSAGAGAALPGLAQLLPIILSMI